MAHLCCNGCIQQCHRAVCKAQVRCSPPPRLVQLGKLPSKLLVHTLKLAACRQPGKAHANLHPAVVLQQQVALLIMGNKCEPHACMLHIEFLSGQRGGRRHPHTKQAGSKPHHQADGCLGGGEEGITRIPDKRAETTRLMPQSSSSTASQQTHLLFLQQCIQGRHQLVLLLERQQDINIQAHHIAAAGGRHTAACRKAVCKESSRWQVSRQNSRQARGQAWHSAKSVHADITHTHTQLHYQLTTPPSNPATLPS